MGERSACEGMDTERAGCLFWALRWPAYHQWGVVGGTVAWQRRALLESADQGRAA